MSIGTLPNVSFIGQNRDVSSALSALFRTGSLKNNQTKSRRRMNAKDAVVFVKSVRQLSCASQDTEHGSQKQRSVMQTSEKKKVRRSEKYKSKLFISEVPTL